MIDTSSIRAVIGYIVPPGHWVEVDSGRGGWWIRNRKTRRGWFLSEQDVASRLWDSAGLVEYIRSIVHTTCDLPRFRFRIGRKLVR